jgi:hypothetical protein
MQLQVQSVMFNMQDKHCRALESRLQTFMLRGVICFDNCDLAPNETGEGRIVDMRTQVITHKYCAGTESESSCKPG